MRAQIRDKRDILAILALVALVVTLYAAGGAYFMHNQESQASSFSK